MTLYMLLGGIRYSILDHHHPRIIMDDLMKDNLLVLLIVLLGYLVAKELVITTCKIITTVFEIVLGNYISTVGPITPPVIVETPPPTPSLVDVSISWTWIVCLLVVLSVIGVIWIYPLHHSRQRSKTSAEEH